MRKKHTKIPTRCPLVHQCPTKNTEYYLRTITTNPQLPAIQDELNNKGYPKSAQQLMPISMLKICPLDSLHMPINIAKIHSLVRDTLTLSKKPKSSKTKKKREKAMPSMLLCTPIQIRAHVGQ
ncbi:hypothetical protein PRUPE_1G536400 [Prunus persica]|uniref:Uncharacterized protein n=1 Tax=Prunus persica TaxID=3760 RepID=A0A251RHF5_PRUPE|nr:hypothetical protein PRUPE_1G536400 [Prunus persica]